MYCKIRAFHLQENEIMFGEHTTLTSLGHAVVINLSALSGFVRQIWFRILLE